MSNLALNSQTKKSRKRYKLANKERVKALAINNPGLTHQEIATLENVERSTVSRILSQYDLDRKKIDKFAIDETLWLKDFRRRVITNITDEEIKNAPLNVKLVGYGIAVEKDRLLSGESTENYSVINKLIVEAKDYRKALEGGAIDMLAGGLGKKDKE